MTRQNAYEIPHQSLLLRQMGEAMYGSDWQSALCDAINVSPRSMRRWAAGTDAIPSGVLADIHRHAEAIWVPIKYFDEEIVKLLAEEMTDPLRPVPNSMPMPDTHGLSFAMQTGAGRSIRCYIRREVLDDRVDSNPFAKVTAYFADHSDTFYVAAQRKFDAGDYGDSGIEIGNIDVVGLDLPDERRR